MEPERKIEKLLRAYARKRRAQAGDPLTLHPATWRLLQGEAARNAPKSGEEDESVSLWELFRRQWVAFLGFTLIIFFGAMLLLPSLSNVKFKEQQAATMSHLKQIGAAAQIAAVENNGKLPATLDALTNHLLADKILTDAENGGRFAYVAGGASLDDLQSNTVLAYSAADNNGRAVLFANGGVQWLNNAQFSELTNQALFQLAVANGITRRQPAEIPVETAMPNGNVAAANFDRRAAPQTNSFQFASAASQNPAFGLQYSFKNTSASGNNVLVLASFQVQQNASAIRVMDQDGSVYDGFLLPENAVARDELAPAAALPEIQNKDLSAGKKVSQAAQNYFFRVAGTNRILKQSVVFTGNLLATSNATTNLLQSFGGKSGFGGGGGFGENQLQSVLPNQSLWSSSRIVGTALISDTNNIEINAVPISP
jgi:hypothetical protein